jgi:DNA-binding transcriptional regulator YhcF (GntR family)
MTPTDIAPWNRSLNAAVALVAHFERLIATGQLAPGERLPSERDLAVRMSVSRSTLREAMHELESKRLIERARGRGTIVARKPLEVSELIEQLPPDSSIEYVLELRSVVEPDLRPSGQRPPTSCNCVMCWRGRARTCPLPNRCAWMSSSTCCWRRPHRIRCFRRCALSPASGPTVCGCGHTGREAAVNPRSRATTRSSMQSPRMTAKERRRPCAATSGMSASS